LLQNFSVKIVKKFATKWKYRVCKRCVRRRRVICSNYFILNFRSVVCDLKILVKFFSGEKNVFFLGWEFHWLIGTILEIGAFLLAEKIENSHYKRRFISKLFIVNWNIIALLFLCKFNAWEKFIIKFVRVIKNFIINFWSISRAGVVLISYTLGSQWNFSQ